MAQVSSAQAPRLARGDLLWIAGLTLGFEIATCLLRFGFHLESTRDTSFLARLTFGARIHHGYVGTLMLAVGFLLPTDSPARTWLLRIGSALALSDLIHHFLILWPITGSPQFDLTYPPVPPGGR